MDYGTASQNRPSYQRRPGTWYSTPTAYYCDYKLISSDLSYYIELPVPGNKNDELSIGKADFPAHLIPPEDYDNNLMSQPDPEVASVSKGDKDGTELPWASDYNNGSKTPSIPEFTQTPSLRYQERPRPPRHLLRHQQTMSCYPPKERLPSRHQPQSMSQPNCKSTQVSPIVKLAYRMQNSHKSIVLHQA
jgi:hypothetical protein